jgi:hypothetical protein
VPGVDFSNLAQAMVSGPSPVDIMNKYSGSREAERSREATNINLLNRNGS